MYPKPEGRPSIQEISNHPWITKHKPMTTKQIIKEMKCRKLALDKKQQEAS
jgi:hypothetical protein